MDDDEGDVGKVNDTRTTFMLDLQRIEDEHYQLREGEQLQDFVRLMLQYIGDPQPELRDDLIYPTFYTWIKEDNRFTDAELRSLLAVLTDEQHLFYQIGSENDQTVFTRTFSVLPIALIVQRHRQEPLLDQAEFQHLKQSLLRYYQEEKDLRGYLLDGGWAHGAAHGADALDELVQCPESDETVQLEVLASIQGMLQNGIHIFSDEEDERMANIVDTVIDKDLLPQQKIADWISRLAACSDWPRSRAQVIARVNSKNFLRSLYFRRGRDRQGNGLVAAMHDAEGKLNKFAIE
ncbi:MAG: hypothetical protein K0R47_3016 [Brevibacillus sp.]|nr:hypothetical protein [Brevibacillus sp.]